MAGKHPWGHHRKGDHGCKLIGSQRLMKIARMPDGSPEIFHTLQGEGRNTGTPSVFIRSSLCNLSCYWCDTPYTWNWEDSDYEHESPEKFRREEEILSLSPLEVAETAAAFGCPSFVFTGGEPLLQEKAWLEVMDRLAPAFENAHFEIETNGTIAPSSEFLDRIHQVNVSPKLANSGVLETKRIKTEILASLAASGKADFKFVVEQPENLEEIETVQALSQIPKSRVFLMPAASSLETLEENQGWVSRIAQEQGYRYSDRLHLRLYGAKRGV